MTNVDIATRYAQMGGRYFEDFEIGSKSAYSASSIVLDSGLWYFNDALLLSTTNDKKVGLKIY